MMASLMPDELEDSLETRLNKATNLLLLEENWEYIVGFCDLINKDVDGPQIAVRLLVHKIQSPQEKEALFALTTLEACVRNCGQRFQQEIGKFRFINEMIKVISPKYLGNQRTARVRNRCTALLYFWSQTLTQEPKIKEAYLMLKKQGLVKEDPDLYQVNTSTIPDKPIETLSHHHPPPPPPSISPASSVAEASLSDAQKNSIFEDEEKSKLLSRLLKSKNPEDLQAANRLIKNMVKQDMERTEKVTRRTHQLETVSNNVKLLSEMLQNYQPGNSTESDREIMKELSENIEKQRPALFRLASDSDERDSTGIGDILKANDEVIQVLSLYDSLINKSDVGNLLAIDDDGNNSSAVTTGSKNAVLTDPPSKKPVSKELSDLDILTSSATLTSESKEAVIDIGISHSLLDEQLLSLGLPVDVFSTTSTTTSNNIPPVKSSHLELSEIFSFASTQNHSNPLNSSFLGNGPLVQTVGGFGTTQSLQQHPYTGVPSFPNYHNSTNNSSGPSLLPTASLNLTKSGPTSTEPVIPTSTTSTTLGSLDKLSKSLLEQTLTSSGLKPFQPAANPTKVTLNQMGKPLATITNGGTLLSTSLNSIRLGDDVSSSNNEVDHAASLKDLFVPLESIRPGSKPFLTVYERDGIKVLLHFAADRPRPDVQVIAVTVTSTSQFPVKDLVLHSSVSKDFALKMQPASSTHLPAYNPILPPSPVTQVVLVAGVKQENVRLKFDIAYTIDEKFTKASKEVDL